MALAAIKLQERLRIAAYPHANVAWYVHPLALAGADYSTIDNILEGSLIRCTCDTEVIYVRLAARSSNSGALDFMIFLNLFERSEFSNGDLTKKKRLCVCVCVCVPFLTWF